ncbi:patatin-like phospholipase family protein [Roseovarius arcticus]|uniref:patatin-like phospholipase family protein n=1 Tax=Roseovarius arcticus TaxID=2547404 RepID=UPI001110969A|nr:patatin-like phospholipase family protein [Roseovarius arcticus]
MTTSITLGRTPGRRQILAALAALPVAACTSGVGQSGLIATQSSSAPDPLAAYRLFADAGAEVWARHRPPAMSSSELTVLAISGGGEDGAFGAGALAGWTASGERPEFDIVTGISTGALIAPFAFLGSEHDDALRRIFTEHDASDIMTLQPIQALFGDAVYDTVPLAGLIKQFTPPALIKAIAARHAAGGRLFVVTSELDSARASIWNMGLIAQSGNYDLFRAVLRASSALPGLFSPVQIGYVSGGVTYTETHLDGGVHMQFLAIPAFAFAAAKKPRPGGQLFVLINNTLNPVPSATSRSALGISQQALTTIGRASAASAVNATQLFAHENGLGLAVTSIDPASGIVYDPSDRFSSTYMNALYRHGYNRGAARNLWDTL